MSLVLASSSTARARLLEAAGLTFTLAPARVDEDALKAALKAEGARAVDAAIALAAAKAMRCPEKTGLILGADQILDCEGRWFDKPVDRTQAEDHLLALSGRTHALHTGAVIFENGVEIWRHVVSPRVRMRVLEPDFIARYLERAGDAVLNSVGGYQMETLGAHLFTAVEGDPYAIQGLPLLPLLSFLRARGIGL